MNAISFQVWESSTCPITNILPPAPTPDWLGCGDWSVGFDVTAVAVSPRFAALSMPVMIGATGLAVDVGTWYHAKRTIQSAADAAAFAGALDLARQGLDGSATYAPIDAAARDAADRNGFRRDDDGELPAGRWRVLRQRPDGGGGRPAAGLGLLRQPVHGRGADRLGAGGGHGDRRRRLRLGPSSEPARRAVRVRLGQCHARLRRGRQFDP